MNFTIELKKEDFAHFNKYATTRINRTPSLKRKLTLFSVVYWLLLIIFLLEIYFFYDKTCCYNYHHLNKAMIAIGIWFALVNVWQLIYLKLFVSAVVDDEGTVLGKWQIHISEEGITEVSDLCSSSYSWKSIQAVEKDKYNLYLFTDKFKALILPLNQITQEIEAVITKKATSAST